ncbi:MAG TPA: histidine kinase dimerization/phosphoacceptor domain -containing protein [Rhizomicrobium sp.]|nr:histidine kinase dimerization/phosphoacceptor domain -containing protein [Rhizomicrobium sp.]
MQGLFDQIGDARALTQIIVDAVREPVLVLGGDFKILFASVSFCRAFEVDSLDVLGRNLFAVDDGAWDIEGLRALLDRTLRVERAGVPEEIGRDFPRIGRRVLRMHASKAWNGFQPILFLNLEDVTERRAIEAEKVRLQDLSNELLLHKQTLLEEMQHRIVNSLQIIASILMLKARAVNSEETREHLQDAHRRVISVAAVQRHLHSTGRADLIDIAPYLTKLCQSLAESMIGESHPAKLKVVADDSQMVSGDAVSLGLIVTELVINALKYAFPGARAGAMVTIRYEVDGPAWELSVADNGSGKADTGPPAKGGLGTSIVKALAQQLGAQVAWQGSPDGTTVRVTHATFVSRFKLAS